MYKIGDRLILTKKFIYRNIKVGDILTIKHLYKANIYSCVLIDSRNYHTCIIIKKLEEYFETINNRRKRIINEI